MSRQTVTVNSHVFGAHCNTDLDAASGDLARNVLHHLQDGRAESGDRRFGGVIGKAPADIAARTY